MLEHDLERHILDDALPNLRGWLIGCGWTAERSERLRCSGTCESPPHLHITFPAVAASSSSRFSGTIELVHRFEPLEGVLAVENARLVEISVSR